MTHLLRLLLSWSVRRVLIFVILVAAMVAFVQVRSAWQKLPELSAEVELLERRKALVEAEVARERARAEAGLREIAAAEEPALLRRLAALRAGIAAGEAGGGFGLAVGAARGDGDAVARALAGRFRLQLMRREEALILARLEALRQGGQVNALAGRARVLDARIAALEQRIEAIERRFPTLSRVERVPLVRRIEGPWRDLRTARQELESARAERARLAGAYRVARAAYGAAATAWRDGRSALLAVPAPTDGLDRQIEDRRRQLTGHWASRIWREVGPVLGWAAWAMLAIVVAPPAVKAFWFFLVAPLAGRLQPIRIGKPGSGAIHWADRRRADEPAEAGSAVSWRLRLEPGEELLVRPDYLQSSVAGTPADSRLLLSPRLPFASLASGLVGLTRLRPARPTSVALSATRDLIDEIGVIEIPEGSAMVFRPRTLVGVVHPAGRPPRLERVWRLGCPMAWLTLRLRHLLFHGPCALVVKGARGIVLEPADDGRRVADAATMGWSSGLACSVTRSETFLAYLTGKQSLFHDIFDGPGAVAYEEMPRARSRSGLFGRGLEGLGDGLLKIVGL